MRSVVEIEIEAPRDRVAELYADPRNSPKWMHDLARYEPLSGEQGVAGSTYRLVPKDGDLVFRATVVERAMPRELRLELEGPRVGVSVHARLEAIAPGRTRLISEEVFRFDGLFGAVRGLFASSAIRAAHRRHMEDFRRFAEASGQRR